MQSNHSLIGMPQGRDEDAHLGTSCQVPLRPKPIPVPMRRRNLHGEIATLMRDMIIAGDLPAGERINESELGPRLGVSRTPLREAIRTLASEGLVELVPSKGAVVRQFSLDDEPTCSMRSVARARRRTPGLRERASDEQIAEVLAMRDDDGFVKRRERMAYYKVNQAIHGAMVALAQNPTIGELHEVQARLKRIAHRQRRGAGKWADAVAEHEQMAAALRQRDGEALARVLGLHMDRTRDRVADSL
ncbi:MAG: GntR family transcriptional regulator [Burkholderiaceae bacterium]